VWDNSIEIKTKIKIEFLKKQKVKSEDLKNKKREKNHPTR
jgi:hypothetical protein